MSVFHPQDQETPLSSEHWWCEAERFWNDAVVLYKGGGSKDAIVDKMHGTIERAIKAIVIAKEPESLGIDHHNLFKLSKQANIYDELSKEQQSFVAQFHNAHFIASYPGESVEEKRWHSEKSFAMIAVFFKNLYEWLREYYLRLREGSDQNGGQNECN